MVEVRKEDVLEIENYIRKVEGRMTRVNATSNEISRIVDRLNHKKALLRSEYESELKGIKLDLERLREDVRSVQKVIIQMISELKNTVKAEDLNRLNRRVDAWAPESFVTKREAEMMIEDALK